MTYTIPNIKGCVQQLWLIFYHFVCFHYHNKLKQWMQCQ